MNVGEIHRPIYGSITTWVTHYSVTNTFAMSIFFSLLTWCQHHPETDIAGLALRVEVPTRRPAFSPLAAPTAAAEHAVRARCRSLRIDGAPAGIRPVPVLAPLPETAVHIIQAPRVGQLLPHRMRRAAAVVQIPRVLGQARVAWIIAMAEARRGPSPAGILPLRLCRQSIDAVGPDQPRSPFPLREPSTVIRGIFPTHRLHRPVEVAGEYARLAASHPQIIGLGHLVFAHVKALGQRHHGLRTFVVEAVHFVCRAAH